MKGYNSKKNNDFQNKRKHLPNNSKEIQVQKNKTQEENAITREDLIKKDYKKLPEEALSVISPIIEKVPSLLAEQSIQHAVTKSFNEAVKGSFRCVLDSGLHLAERKGQPNVYLGTGLDNTTNKITAQASWLKNESVLEIPVSPQMVAGVFNILSIVTAQHFLSQINDKLSNIDKRLNSIEQRLDDALMGKLLGNHKHLQKISERLIFIQQIPDRIISERNQINDIIRKTEGDFIFFQRQIENIIKSFDSEDNENVLNEKLQKLHFFQLCNVISVKNYLYGQILYILLNNINHPDELEQIINSIENHISINNDLMNFGEINEKKYINQVKSLNRLSVQDTRRMIEYNFENNLPWNNPIVPQNKLFHWNRCNEINKELSIISKEYQNSIDNLRNSVLSSNEKTELIYINGEWFYKQIDSSDEKTNNDTDESQENNSR